jgi:hypothetical protein
MATPLLRMGALVETTQVYDRADEVSFREIERVWI